MKSTIFLIVKVIAIGAFLLLADITLRYTIERIDVFEIRPVTIPHYDSSHLYNILSAFPYLFLIVGWCYILVTFIYIFFRKTTEFSWYFNVIIAFVLFMAFFLIFWLFDRGGPDKGVSLLKEGIVVYLILALLIELVFNFFKRSKLV
jgi:hypothetical protein